MVVQTKDANANDVLVFDPSGVYLDQADQDDSQARFRIFGQSRLKKAWLKIHQNKYEDRKDYLVYRRGEMEVPTDIIDDIVAIKTSTVDLTTEQEKVLTDHLRGIIGDDERLKHTIQISKGLSSPASKLGDRVPPLNFPQGYLREGTTPRVSKGQVGHLSSAGPGDVVFTDTFKSGDSKFSYGQAYFDYASHWGDVFPLRSRTEVGRSFADFCCRNWIPLVLVRDNIGENVGGSLLDECRMRNVKSAYICSRITQKGTLVALRPWRLSP
jgi:hypothetical protein